MENNNDDTQEKKEQTRSEQIKATLEARKQINNSQVGDWTMIKDFLQDIQAADRIDRATFGKPPTPLTKLMPKLEERIRREFKGDQSAIDNMLASIPSYRVVLKWTKDKQWEANVRERMGANHLFGLYRRASILNAVYEKAIKGDVRAMELYFKLSGDYPYQYKKNSEKSDRDWFSMDDWNDSN